MSDTTNVKPARLVRKQILISADQSRRLKARAAATARSEGELVREAVGDWLDRHNEQADDWKRGLRQLRGMWKDRKDIDEFYAQNRERRRLRRERMNRLMASSSPGADE